MVSWCLSLLKWSSVSVLVVVVVAFGFRWNVLATLNLAVLAVGLFMVGYNWYHAVR